MSKQQELRDWGWSKIFSIGDKYYISFDEGGIVVKMNTYEISRAKMNYAAESEQNAEEIAREIQKGEGS